jgi:hypothetical protein
LWLAGIKLENRDKLFNGRVEESRLGEDMMGINCLAQSAGHELMQWSPTQYVLTDHSILLKQ